MVVHLGCAWFIIESFELPTATLPEGGLTVFVSPDLTELNLRHVRGCVRYETCRAIMDAQGLMPEEIARPFTCTAFPQSTLIGRFWVIMLISVILVPVQLCAPCTRLLQPSSVAVCARAESVCSMLMACADCELAGWGGAG
jgi:hypothetical protein